MACPASAKEKDFLEEAAKKAEGSVGKYAGNFSLIDQNGVRFSMRDLAGKPVAVSFIYTGCGHTCPTIISSLRDTFKDADGFGQRFTALTVGIDPSNDTPARLKEFGKRFAVDFTKWRFASADARTIKALADNLGFYYKRAGREFEHMNMVTILDSNGTIYKQVYGVVLEPADILPHLYGATEAGGSVLAPRPIGLIERIKLLCYTYDKKTGTYRPDYGFLMVVALGLTMQGVIAFMLFYIFRGGSKKPAR